MTSIIIPDSVTSIGGAAIHSCVSLTNIQFNGTTAQWQAIAFGKVDPIPGGNLWNSNTGDYIITCTDGTISKDGVVTPK